MATNYKLRLLQRIKKRKSVVGIIGMGYVGSALSELIVGAGYQTLGFVRNAARAERINNANTPRLRGTTDTTLLSTCDVILVCVQTPIHEDKKPDLSFIQTALYQIAENITPGQLIVIESSYAPGTTRKVVLPILKNTSLREGQDFYLSFSPERVDPGNKQFSLDQIPKVVSGLENDSLEVATAFYQTIINEVVPVSSLETAELVKIFENTYRLVNISLVNEVTEYAKAVGLDMWEVISAAATKPFGFMPHYPGPGIGGHCIPVDPYYLIDHAKKVGVKLDLIEAAGKVNDDKPRRVVEQTVALINLHNGQKSEHKVLLVGVAYKPDIDDTRESPALKIWKLFEAQNISVSFYDPYVKEMNGTKSIGLSVEELQDHDAIVITTDHSNISYDALASLEKLIIDTRNVYRHKKKPHIFYI